MVEVANIGYTGYIPVTIPQVVESSNISGIRPDIIDIRDVPRHGLSTSSEVSVHNTIHLFILGSLIFLFIFAWVNLINIMINVYYELVNPTTPTLSQHLKDSDFYSAIIKQLTYAVIFTIILFIYVFVV